LIWQFDQEKGLETFVEMERLAGQRAATFSPRYPMMDL
jgi:hypothetical protein